MKPKKVTAEDGRTKAALSPAEPTPTCPCQKACAVTGKLCLGQIDDYWEPSKKSLWGVRAPELCALVVEEVPSTPSRVALRTQRCWTGCWVFARAKGMSMSPRVLSESCCPTVPIAAFSFAPALSLLALASCKQENQQFHFTASVYFPTKQIYV